MRKAHALKVAAAVAFFLFMAVHLVPSASYGREEEAARLFNGRKPLSEILNPDGSLKVGADVRGSFDSRGYRMFSDSVGRPVFVPKQSGHPSGSGAKMAEGDQFWDDRFGHVFNTNGSVLALAVNGTHIYVGGSFTEAGGEPANFIAKWDGTSWLTLGSGVNGDVNAIAVSGSDVYVGGWFSEAGGIPVNSIAKWDGSTWSALGSGVIGGIKAIALSGTDVYVGGNFTEAGGGAG